MANQLAITGKFLGAGNIKQIGQNNRNVRSFWLDITDNPAYPNTPEFQLFGDKVNLVDNLKKGQTIEVKFNINGRKYQRKDTGKEAIMTNLDAWQINVLQMQSAASVAPRATAAPAPAPMTGPGQYAQTGQVAQSGFPYAGTEDDGNDLPF
ncbi:DUF3127 domain-containing protein [Spirosoma endbachense]|uniref:DUF3127 domain-containing protein n=1 Tax=Spirosoma endbachense TaxID=2666025 RepID=A0A6P1W1M2_9BACT|nr:DUF3127 domain-containing protein [Spirosoma endbachense]QHV97880.1 DUF3127 domain-containing protein [Spirosoma endbachense]